MHPDGVPPPDSVFESKSVKDRVDEAVTEALWERDRIWCEALLDSCALDIRQLEAVLRSFNVKRPPEEIADGSGRGGNDE